MLTPLALSAALIALATVGDTPGTSPPPGPTSLTLTLVMPASGTVVKVPGDLAARWELEGTVTLTPAGWRPTDRLIALGPDGRRAATIAVQKKACIPPASLADVSPWPTLGFAGIRNVDAERRTITSCKAPDLAIELRFAPTLPADPIDLVEEADRWEPLVAALHSAYGSVETQVPTPDALARLTLDATPELAADLASLSNSITLLGGQTLTGPPSPGAAPGPPPGDAARWHHRKAGEYDYFRLVAPTGAGLSLQLIPFAAKYTCEKAMEYATKPHPPAPSDAPPLVPPPGWDRAQPIGPKSGAFCLRTDKGGLIVIAASLLEPRAWLPLAGPQLTRLAEAFGR
ncbi:MAG: hypothetical protein JNJ59_22720 [Deltaproteobacteria bacterium]|nr:hypothetical protein [Deltaproteobacteria bacterium]